MLPRCISHHRRYSPGVFDRTSAVDLLGEVASLESPYISRMDYQGVSDPVMLARAVEATTGFKVSAAA